MKVLLTGSSGRIGHAIGMHLRAEQHQVIGLDRLPSPVTQIVGDIADPAVLRHALRGMDAVIHTAALHAPHVGQVADSEFERINVQATQALAHRAADMGIRRFIFTSTTALYGAGASPGGQAAWINEDSVPQPQTIYHRSKLAAEQALQAMALPLQLAVTVLRMSRCFPEPAPLMAAYRLHRGIDARDVASAHGQALTWQQAGFRRYLVSGATPFLPGDTARLLQRAPEVLAQRAPALVQAFQARGWPLPTGIDRVYDAQRAMQELAWQPRHGFASVLEHLDAHSPDVLPPAYPNT